MINQRQVTLPNPKLAKRLSKNHFEDRKKSTGSYVAADRDNSLDQDKFDSAGASNLMQSKHTKSKMNSLFLDTKMFDTSSLHYDASLSKPGAL